jgi:DNA-binding NarL/FixJ family response regulator
MQVLDGISAAVRLRRLAPKSHVLFVADCGDRRSVANAFAVGAFDCIPSNDDGVLAKSIGRIRQAVAPSVPMSAMPADEERATLPAEPTGEESRRRSAV